jgi:hypothetical protein
MDKDITSNFDDAASYSDTVTPRIFKNIFWGAIMLLLLFFNIKNAYKVDIHNRIAMFSLKPGGIRTRAFCS